MQFLKNTYRNMLSLLLILSAPSCVYGNQSLQSMNPIAMNPETTDNQNQDSVKESDVDNISLMKKCRIYRTMTYYLYIADFIQSFIEIPTSNVLVDSSTVSSTYLAGRAPIYNQKNERAGTCSASFLCMQNEENSIFTDISNYLSVDNGLIVTWFTPTTLINLELDSIVHSMVTECIVVASTKVGFNPFYGKKFNMIVSSDNEKIYFQLSKIKS